MSTQSCDPFGDPSREDKVDAVPTDLMVEMGQIGVQIERRVQVTEPIVRDFNRRMHDVFGACASSADGSWATIDTAGEVVVSIGLDDIFRLSTGLEHVGRLIEADVARRDAVNRRGGSEHLGVVAPLLQGGPTLHPPTPSQLRGTGDKEGE
jgi:hypothetical protein